MEPLVVRPTREHAVAAATDLFLRRERVDMGPVAATLGIGRTTLYRWVGDRERLLGDVLGGLTARTWQVVRGQATGEGADRAVDTVRRFMETTAAFHPLRLFAEREPQLALRVLASPTSVVPASIAAGIRQAFLDNVPARDLPSEELIDIMVQVGTALEWTPIVIGQPPAIERATRLLRSLLSTR